MVATSRFVQFAAQFGVTESECNRICARFPEYDIGFSLLPDSNECDGVVYIPTGEVFDICEFSSFVVIASSRKARSYEDAVNLYGPPGSA